jgi:hypothetical protein
VMPSMPNRKGIKTLPPTTGSGLSELPDIKQMYTSDAWY